MTQPANNRERFPPPPNLPPPTTNTGRLVHWFRRSLDLPVTSLYPHLAAWLGGLSGKVLEVGCGAQPYRHLLAKGCQYQGLDWEGVKDVFGYEVPDTVYYDGSVFPFPEHSFDHLYLTEVLEHIYDLVPFLTECQRVLRPGGSLFLSVPFQARYHYIPYDYWRFTPAALERLLSEVGFQDIKIKPRGTDISVACYKFLTVLYRWIYGSMGKKFVGILMAPIGGAALAIGHLSLRTGLGSQDDTLGYIVVASRK